MTWLHEPDDRTLPDLTPLEDGPRHARRREGVPLLPITVMAAITVPAGLWLGSFGSRILSGDPAGARPAHGDPAVPPYSTAAPATVHPTVRHDLRRPPTPSLATSTLRPLTPPRPSDDDTPTPTVGTPTSTPSPTATPSALASKSTPQWWAPLWWPNRPRRTTALNTEPSTSPAETST